MELREVKYLVSGGETGTVEFKRKASHPEKIVRELVAFANTEGGYLFLGVNDDGSIPGLKFPEDDIYVMENAIARYCRPELPYHLETIPLNSERAVVLFRVEGSDRKPHYILEEDPTPHGRQGSQFKKRVFVRSGDRSIQASREMREIIRRRNRPRDIKFNLGTKERTLFQYLEKNTSITVQQFRELAGISSYSASRTLILLTLANVLEVVPDDKGDRYKFDSASGWAATS